MSGLKKWKGHYTKSLRAAYWDYSSYGSYYITINTEYKAHYFGKIKNGVVCLNKIGQMAYNDWQDLPNHFQYIKLGTFIIMPNHMHGIINNFHPRKVKKNKETKNLSRISPLAGSISSIIRSYKGGITRKSNEQKWPFKWQPGYFDQIITNQRHYNNATNYINNNPKEWSLKYGK
jgi:REP element-mobilizing transposase RayT